MFYVYFIIIKNIIPIQRQKSEIGKLFLEPMVMIYIPGKYMNKISKNFLRILNLVWNISNKKSNKKNML